MKKKVITVVVILVALLLASAAGVAVYNKNKDYKNKKAHDASVAQSAKVQKETELSARLEKVQAAYDTQRIECEKGQGAYGLLPITTKKTLPQPVCGAPVIQ